MDGTEKNWRSEHQKYSGRYIQDVSEDGDSRFEQGPMGLAEQKGSSYTKPGIAQETVSK